MKIIERGIDPRTYVYRSTCLYCKTKYEYQADEVNRRYVQGCDEFYFPCEVCHKEVTGNPASPYSKGEYQNPPLSAYDR